MEAVPSPIEIPVVTLTNEEVAEARELIAKGELPPDWFDRYRKKVQNNVFGADHRVDGKGNPIEQGIGSKNNETANHFAALRKAEREGLEPSGSYDAALQEIWKREPKRAQELGLPVPKGRA